MAWLWTHLRMVNLILCLLGFLVMGGAFTLFKARPDVFSDQIIRMAVLEVSNRFPSLVVAERAGEADRTRLGRLLTRVDSELTGRFEVLRSEETRAQIDKFVESLLIEACKLDCADADMATTLVHEIYAKWLERFKISLDRLRVMVTDEFDAVLAELRTDLSIFTGANAVLFALTFLLTLAKAEAQKVLLPISIILSVATVWASYFYLFNQNWIRTVFLGDYWGYSYITLVSVLFLWLLDIGVNRARVTRFALILIGGVSPSAR